MKTALKWIAVLSAVTATAVSAQSDSMKIAGYGLGVDIKPYIKKYAELNRQANWANEQYTWAAIKAGAFSGPGNLRIAFAPQMYPETNGTTRMPVRDEDTTAHVYFKCQALGGTSYYITENRRFAGASASVIMNALAAKYGAPSTKWIVTNGRSGRIRYLFWANRPGRELTAKERQDVVGFNFDPDGVHPGGGLLVAMPLSTEDTVTGVSLKLASDDFQTVGPKCTEAVKKLKLARANASVKF